VSREHELAILAEREEGIRLALEYPSGAERPGGYVAHYSRAGCLKALREIAAERARLQPRQVPATASGSRRAATASPAAPRDHRNRQVRHQPGREHLMLRGILVAAGVIAAFATSHFPGDEHYSPNVRLIVRVAIAAAFIVPAMLLEWRAKAAAKRAKAAAASASAPRAASAFGQYRGGR
jgi:hypothetical protein